MKFTSRLLKHRQFWSVICLLALDEAFFGFTDPFSLPSVALILGFGLLGYTLYQLARLVLVIAGWYGLKFGRHKRRLALIITGVVSGLLALQSIGELTSRDIVVLVPLAIIAYFYLSVGSLRQPTDQ